MEVLSEAAISAYTSYYTRTGEVEEAAQDFSTCTQRKHHQKQSAALQLKLQWQIRSLSRNRNSPRAAYSIKLCFTSLNLYMSSGELCCAVFSSEGERELLYFALSAAPASKKPLRKRSSALMPSPCSWRWVDDALPSGSDEQSPSRSQRWTCTVRLWEIELWLLL